MDFLVIQSGPLVLPKVALWAIQRGPSGHIKWPSRFTQALKGNPKWHLRTSRRCPPGPTKVALPGHPKRSSRLTPPALLAHLKCHPGSPKVTFAAHPKCPSRSTQIGTPGPPKVIISGHSVEVALTNDPANLSLA